MYTANFRYTSAYKIAEVEADAELTKHAKVPRLRKRKRTSVTTVDYQRMTLLALKEHPLYVFLVNNKVLGA